MSVAHKHKELKGRSQEVETLKVIAGSEARGIVPANHQVLMLLETQMR